MTGSGVVLNNTHVYNAIVSYDGSNLELIVTDTTDPTKRYSHTWTGINLPSIVGGTSAWVGFTGVSGGYAASEDIDTWTWDQPVAVINTVPASVYNGTSFQFAAQYIDRSGVPLANPAGMTWSLDAGSTGSITSSGLFTTPFNVSGTATPRVTINGATSAVSFPIALDPIFSRRCRPQTSPSTAER